VQYNLNFVESANKVILPRLSKVGF